MSAPPPSDRIVGALCRDFIFLDAAVKEEIIAEYRIDVCTPAQYPEDALFVGH